MARPTIHKKKASVRGVLVKKGERWSMQIREPKSDARVQSTKATPGEALASGWEKFVERATVGRNKKYKAT